MLFSLIVNYMQHLFSHTRFRQSSAHSDTRGFTLLEMIVAVGLFTIVATVALVGVVRALDANRKVQATQVIINKLNFALESMTRDIRFGHKYKECGSSCLEFKKEQVGQSIQTIRYNLNGDVIERCVDGSCQDITPVQVEVDQLVFTVSGASKTDDKKPRVSILLHGLVGRQEFETDVTLQTTVNQRRSQNPES